MAFRCQPSSFHAVKFLQVEVAVIKSVDEMCRRLLCLSPANGSILKHGHLLAGPSQHVSRAKSGDARPDNTNIDLHIARQGSTLRHLVLTPDRLVLDVVVDHDFILFVSFWGRFSMRGLTSPIS